MAFDPHREDYQRLGLRFARSLDSDDPRDAAVAFATFGRRFAQNRDSLPQSDADRAFHLVADATTLIDYKLPFANDEEAETLISRARTLLGEAISLDERCHDAVRMQVAATTASFEGYYDFLRQGAEEVKASCDERGAEAAKDSAPERAQLAASIAMAPYLRWMAMLAEKAVICGRNREALRYANELLELDPADPADVRFTAALAYAKLEDDQGLDAFERRLVPTVHSHSSGNAWSSLARASLAYRRRDFFGARKQLRIMVASYPHAAVALARQRELPDGVFSRLCVPPYSEDEIIIAASEGTVLFQEGRDALGRGSFGSWVMLESLALATKEQLVEMSDLVETAATLVGKDQFNPSGTPGPGNRGQSGGPETPGGAS